MTEPAIPPAAHRGALLTVFLVVFIDLLGFGIVLPQMPLISKALFLPLLPGDSNGPLRGLLIGLLFAAFSGMQFLFSPAWGRLSDRIGRRPVLLAGLASSTIFYAMFGVGAAIGANGQPLLGVCLLFLARIGAGIAGATIATAQAVIADVTPADRRSKGMALIGAAFGIGFTFGPAIGGLLLWKLPQWPGAVGYAAALMSGVSAVIAYFQLSETLNPANVARAAGGHSLGRLWTALKDPRIGLVILSFFLATFAFAKFETTLALLNEVLGFDPMRNTLVFTFIGFMLIIASGGIYRRLAGRVRDDALLAIGIGCMVFGLSIVAGVAYTESRPDDPNRMLVLVAFFVGLAILVTGYSFLNPSAQALISKRSDPARQGEFLGVNQSAAALARVVGPAAGPFLFSIGFRHVLPYAVAAGLLIVVMGLIPRLREET